MFLLLAFSNSFFVDLGNTILNIRNGKILLLLPVSTLYKNFTLFWQLLIFNFAIMSGLLALELMKLIFTV